MGFNSTTTVMCKDPVTLVALKGAAYKNIIGKKIRFDFIDANNRKILSKYYESNFRIF